MQTLVFPAMEKCNNTYPPSEQVSQEECIQRGLAHRNKRASRLLSKANGGHSCDPAFLEHQSSMSIDRYSLSRFNIRHCTGSCSHHRLAHPSLRGWILLFAIVTVACNYSEGSGKSGKNGMTRKGVIERRQQFDPLLAQSRKVTADAAEHGHSLFGAETPGDLLLHFDHPKISLRLVIVKWDRKIVQEPEHGPLAPRESIQQIASRTLFGSPRCALGRFRLARCSWRGIGLGGISPGGSHNDEASGPAAAHPVRAASTLWLAPPPLSY